MFFCNFVFVTLHHSIYRHFADNPGSAVRFISSATSNRSKLTSSDLSSFDRLDDILGVNLLFDLEPLRDLTPYDKIALIQANHGRTNSLLWLATSTRDGLVDWLSCFQELGRQIAEGLAAAQPSR